MKQASIGLTVLGALVLAVGAAWPFLFSAKSAWTEEKALARSDLQDELHLLHMKVVKIRRGNLKSLGDEEPGDIEKRYREGKTQLEELNREFEGIVETPIPKILCYSGAFCLLGGLLGVRASSSQ